MSFEKLIIERVNEVVAIRMIRKGADDEFIHKITEVPMARIAELREMKLKC